MTTPSHDALASASSTLANLGGLAPAAAPAPTSFHDEADAGAASARQGADLQLLAGVTLEVSVEMGRRRLSIRDLLSLQSGQVIPLDRAADAPVDLLANDQLVARGELVVIDGELAVRITELRA